MSDEEKESALRDKVFSWLKKQGYPLEMKVSAGLRSSASFQVRQGWHYSDIETSQLREIDVVATASEVYGYATVHFSFECKATTKPWILFTSKHTTENYHRLRAFCLTSPDAQEILASAVFPFTDDEKNSDAHMLGKQLSWFWEVAPAGYALTQAFDGNNDVPYGATTSVVKAALHWFSDSPEHNSTPPIVVSFPVVVTTSPLFECYMDEMGEVQLRKIDRGFLFFQRNFDERLPTKVAVVSESGLEKYLAECAVTADVLLKMFEPRVKEIWEKVKSS